MAIFTAILLGLLLLIGLLWYYFHVPGDLPRQLPRIPIYVSLIGLWNDMGQDEVYERWLQKPLEKHGAVIIWFAGRWSILVTRPQYLVEIFRNENLYAKAGSQVKIPWSVIASLVGDNIINTHGETWKLYTHIMKPGMQKRAFDTRPMVRKSEMLVDIFLEKQREAEVNELKHERFVLVNSDIQKWAIDLMGESFLDYDFQCLEKSHVRVEELQTIIKRTLFNPLYFNFPVLDKWPNIFISRRRAFAIMKEFEDTLCRTVFTNPRKQKRQNRKIEDKQVVHMLEEALDAGDINDTQFCANLKITFLTAHENVQQLMNSTFWELGMNLEVQDRLRQEILDIDAKIPTADTVNSMPYLTATVFELLRLYPPVSQLINRVTTEPAVLAGKIIIPARTWVGWNAYGVQIDKNVWGPTAREFIPERWGTTIDEMQAKFRRETVKGTYIPFNAHTRKCLGYGFALLEVKIMLFVLLRRAKWIVHPDYKLKLTPGGILAPIGCKVVFSTVDQDLDKRAVEKPILPLNE